MTTNLDEVTLGLALTAAGAVVMAALITGIVEILARALPQVVTGHEQGFTLVLAAIVVGAAVFDAVNKDVLELDIAVVFAAIVAWYGIARVAMGIHDDVISRNPQTSLGTSI